MELESLFWAALQSSFFLGLIHGINPCGHSWLVLAPFVMGEKKGRYVAILTLAFVGGTAIACLLLGATLGTISSLLPPSASFWVDIFTSIILLILGLLLIYNPHLLHSHSHDHDHHHHDHLHDSNHSHDSHHGNTCNLTVNSPSLSPKKKWLVPTLFGVGFVNMIIPCPTAAVMYGYALNSGSAFAATIVFGSYALSTAIAVGGVIYVIFRVTAMAGRLQKDWVEPLIMRVAGFVIVIFSSYGLYAALATTP